MPAEPRYVVKPLNEDDVVLRPCIFDAFEHVVFSVGWALNDWDRAQAFADELNAIRGGSTLAPAARALTDRRAALKHQSTEGRIMEPEPIEQHTEDGVTVTLYPDYDCPSPIDDRWSDQVGTLYSVDGAIGDRMAAYDHAAEFVRELRNDGYTVLPLRFSDYGSSGARIHETDLDDANALYAVSRSEVEYEWSGNRAHARRYLRVVIEELDRYLQGDCYGYAVEAPEAGYSDSCWGFIGETYVREVIAESVEAAREALKRERIARADAAARDVVTV